MSQLIHEMTATEIAARVNERELDPADVVSAHLRRLEDGHLLNAVITDCADQAQARARQGLRGPLAGVPLVVKDMFDTAGVRTTYGSSIFQDHVPVRTADAVTALERAGAVVIGKANQDEFAWGTTSQNPHFGSVENPVRPGRVAGGSSGGNAAALAAFQCALGLATDTGGSARIPAACCDVVGFKPAHGSISVAGVFPLAPSFDVVAPMARTVSDCALAFCVLSGTPFPSPRLAGNVVGLLAKASGASAYEPSSAAGDYDPGQPTAVARAMTELGAEVVDVSLPAPDAEIVPFFLYEAACSHRRTFPARRDDYGPVSQLKWETAAAVPMDRVRAARRALAPWRRAARSEMNAHLLLAPTLGMDIPRIDVWEPDVRVPLSTYTREANYLGWAALAIGDFQLIGPDNVTVLAAGLALEQAGIGGGAGVAACETGPEAAAERRG